jgi:exopolyphosphatase/pppGpp-phosphohydrolase
LQVRRHLDGVGGARPDAALAAGGSARALRKLVGWTLDEARLERSIEMLAGRSPSKITRKHGIEARRARTLLAGAVILAEVRALLGVPFEVARGGLREGLAAELLAELQAA